MTTPPIPSREVEAVNRALEAAQQAADDAWQQAGLAGVIAVAVARRRCQHRYVTQEAFDAIGESHRYCDYCGKAMPADGHSNDGHHSFLSSSLPVGEEERKRNTPDQPQQEN